MPQYMTPENAGEFLCQGKYTTCQGPKCSLWNWGPSGYITYETKPWPLPSYPVWKPITPTKGTCGLNHGE